MIKNPSTPSESKPGQDITSRVSPFLMGLAYPLFRYLVLPIYFSQIEISGQDNLPQGGAVILAPTHRSRWDPLLVTYATGRLVTGRDLRFMVSIDEMKGLQGWFLERLGVSRLTLVNGMWAVYATALNCWSSSVCW